MSRHLSVALGILTLQSAVNLAGVLRQLDDPQNESKSLTKRAREAPRGKAPFDDLQDFGNRFWLQLKAASRMAYFQSGEAVLSQVRNLPSRLPLFAMAYSCQEKDCQSWGKLSSASKMYQSLLRRQKTIENLEKSAICGLIHA
jgi:hypothetical protein